MFIEQMATPKLLTTLRRVLHFTQDFAQYRVAYNHCASQYQTFSTRKTSIFEDNNPDVNSKPQRPKTEPIPKITLILLNGSITVTELEDAQRLAKRRNLSLIKVSDTANKAQRFVYKLVSNSTLIDEIGDDEIIQRNKQKSKDTKLLYISGKITEHDLQTKLRNVVKLLQKGNKVKIVLTLNDINPVSSLFSFLHFFSCSYIITNDCFE